MRRFAFFGSLLACLTTAGGATALQQPDGLVIPVGPSLQALFDGRGEGIDALADASTTPETFIPSCSLTFEVILRNAGYDNSFGWYNVTGQKPEPDELYEFLACNDDVGTVKVLDIKSDPRWAGGEVAFYQAAGPGCPTALANQNVFYSETEYNPDSGANPYIHLLTYNSTVVPQAFYFGWEDLLTGNDNDFDDLVTFVTGITCSGGGEPCDTGLAGVCAQGLMQCQSGVLTCVQTTQPGTEACDGFDNDCNDQIDEGDLCPVGEVCDQGNCVPECSSGEFVCPAGKLCNEAGYCIDEDCIDVVCESGEKCVEGDCLGPCENVVCPYGQVCQLGVCLDPCAPITCDTEQVCVAGVCVDKCPCRDCEDGEVCLDSGSCVAAACEDVECPEGEHCDPTSGACISDCDGATCPLGQVCEDGTCVEDTTGEGGGSGEGGSILTGSGAGGESAAGGSGEGGTNATGGSGGGSDSGGSSDGCDCTTGRRGSSGSGVAFAILALALAGYAVRRR